MEYSRLQNLRNLNLLNSDPEERYDRITRISASLFRVPIAILSILDNERQYFKSSFGLDMKTTYRSDSFCSYVLKSKGPLIVTDTLTDPRFRENVYVKTYPFIRFYAGYPVKLPDGNLAGSLCLIDRKTCQLNNEELLLLRDLASIIEDELKFIDIASKDFLTGLPNRRFFMLLAEDIFRSAKLNNNTFSLAVIDLNDFKQINDNFGHGAGNKALIEFSKIIESIIPNNGFIARLGGDEFCLLLKNSTILETFNVINKISMSIIDFNLLAKEKFILSFSSGVAQYDGTKHSSFLDILNEADKNMYLVKSNKKSLL
ncbi:TPA: sensor domain-containing diguanylate cyclase [Enterobacter ludwigii]|nr:sensor domain-containing diguanylate cyclase [Enterobacter ludwigii]